MSKLRKFVSGTGITDYTLEFGGVIRQVSPTESGESRIPLLQANADSNYDIGTSGDAQSNFVDATSSNLPLPQYLPPGTTLRVWGTNDTSWVTVELL